MKANEAPKGKFVYPNKLYARTNDNITLDISYAPQTLDAIEYTRTDAFIEKAENFIYSALNDGIMGTCDIKNFLRLFKKALKGE